MKIGALILFAVLLSMGLVARGEQEPPASQPARVVGSVYGTPITAADIGLESPIDPAVKFDARDVERWTLMTRIQSRFGQSIIDRFVEKHKIEATPEEIEAFKAKTRKHHEKTLQTTEERLAGVVAELALPNLTAEARAKLEKTKALLESLLPMMRDSLNSETPEFTAKSLIVARKIERELHRVYGGRVIFQQLGPEALDARRLLYEENEKNGDLKFDDPGVRYLFYYYYTQMKHTFVDEKMIEKAWFNEN